MLRGVVVAHSDAITMIKIKTDIYKIIRSFKLLLAR